ncbi:DUF58 domain-containing protein [Demequina flava]|uniref:DUF58 domain-containing protein n=1 Tax=Demequina flava TaxID=1095025 RepID=UPI0007807AFF|nr:DUF58 domain-containing protein [Demequina flava]
MSTRHASTRLSPTGSGVGVFIAGVSMVALGVGFASPALTYIGVMTFGAATFAAIWVVVTGIVLPSRYARVSRAVGPGHPMVGAPSKVITTVKPIRWNATTHAMVRGLGVSEQAAAEITGTAHQRAAVSRADRAVTLTYPITPSLRGRWILGPCVVDSADPLGLMRASCAMGATDEVSVWPQIHDLSDVARAIMGEAEQTRSGTRSSSADDASLREYHEGDDLRRVHWASSARRGTMLVRSDEHEGKRPAVVVLDLPFAPQATEWAISAAASIACSVLDSGHAAHIHARDLPPAQAHTGDARARLLDSLIDLEAPARRRAEDLLEPISAAFDVARRGAVVFAVLEPASDETLRALSALGPDGRAWALVRETGNAAAAGRTAASLRAAGWHVALVDSNAGVPDGWGHLLKEAVSV